jgi:hypothetical protein
MDVLIIESPMNSGRYISLSVIETSDIRLMCQIIKLVCIIGGFITLIMLIRDCWNIIKWKCDNIKEDGLCFLVNKCDNIKEEEEEDEHRDYYSKLV